MRTRGLILLMVGIGCSTTAGPDESSQFAEIPSVDQQFALQIGERALIEDIGLEVEFVAVTDDSRCPSHALILCAWEGDGAILVETAASTGGSLHDTLHTNLEPKALDFGSIILELITLEPYPETTTPIPDDEYIATLVARGRR